MTKRFNALFEQLLSEAPSDIGDIGLSGAVKHVKGGVPEGEAKGHWAPLQKLSSEDRETVLNAIFKEVFSEKENTYAPTSDSPEELRDAMQSAIQKVSGSTALKASGKWSAKFLADRLMTLLKGKVKYTTSAEGGELQKDVTQKEMKHALDSALERLSAETQRIIDRLIDKLDPDVEEYTLAEFKDMLAQDNPELEEADAARFAEHVAKSDRLEKVGKNTYRVAQEKEPEQKEMEGSGEVTSGLEDDDLDFDRLVGDSSFNRTYSGYDSDYGKDW